MLHSSSSTNPVHVRRAIAADFPSIDDVLLAAFGAGHGPTVVRLVREMQRTGELVPELVLVAELDGAVVGFIALTWATLFGDGSEPVLLLSPLGVLPEVQRSGIGAELVRTALAAAQGAGATLVVVQGVPAYYPQFGFERASTYGIALPYDVADEAFMVYRIGDGGRPGPGTVVLPSSFAFLRDAVLLEQADAYFDAAPRSGADAEDIGPFRLFRPRIPWPYYARPRPVAGGEVTLDDVGRVIERCAELSLPVAFEWVVERDPQLAGILRSSGLAVEEHPLLGLERLDRPGGPACLDARTMILPVDRARLLEAWAVAEVAFGAPDGTVDGGGIDARDVRASEIGEDMATMLIDRARTGATVTAVVVEPGVGIVASGMLQRAGDVAEIVAVATLPPYRRRGLAAAVTAELVRHAFALGTATVVLSAASVDAARTYERVGFRRIGSVASASLEE